MLVLFTAEFQASFNKMNTSDQKTATPFFRKAWTDLKSVSGPAHFQTLPYQIAMEVKTKLFKFLKKKVVLDPDDVIFSITDGRFVFLFAVNTRTQQTLEIWCIKRLTI